MEHSFVLENDSLLMSEESNNRIISVGSNSFRHFTAIFQALPICYLINDRVLVMHGGLPMVDGVVLDDIRKLSRTCEPGEQGCFSKFWKTNKISNIQEH